jgi:hypothetical protein
VAEGLRAKLSKGYLAPGADVELVEASLFREVFTHPRQKVVYCGNLVTGGE